MPFFSFLIISEEEWAAKQSEVNFLMDEVERAQTRLHSLEREKVCVLQFVYSNL